MFEDYAEMIRSDIDDIQTFATELSKMDIADTLTARQMDSILAMAAIVNRTTAVMIETLVEVKHELEYESKHCETKYNEEALAAAWEAVKAESARRANLKKEN